MFRKAAGLVIALGLVVYVGESYLGTCDFPASGSQCLNSVTVLGQPFWATAFGNMYLGGYYAPYAYAIVGLAAVICGAVAVAADSLRRTSKLPRRTLLATLGAWAVVAAGLSVWVASLAEGFVCSMYCFNADNSYVIGWGALVAALAGLIVVAAVSLLRQFRPTENRGRYRWAALVIVVVLVAGTLWTAGTAYAGYVRGNNPDNYEVLVAGAGSIVVPVSPGPGNLSLAVKNLGNEPIREIGVTSSSLPQSAGFVFYFNGGEVNPSNVLPVGASATGSMQVGNMKLGNEYEMTVTVTFADGNNQAVVLDVPTVT